MSRALFSPDIAKMVETKDGVNFRVGAAEARARRVLHALVLILGKPAVMNVKDDTPLDALMAGLARRASGFCAYGHPGSCVLGWFPWLCKEPRCSPVRVKGDLFVDSPRGAVERRRRA